MTDITIVIVCVMLVAIIVLVAFANRVAVPWPIALVLGGIAIGYIPHIPVITLRPEIVLLVFLPPLLYWESVNAPWSEFRTSAWWIFQLAFGLVIITTVVIAAVAHKLVPSMGWGAAFVLGAIVSSTDEVAFGPIVERLPIPRHVIATIEGESLVNDATSLILYGVGVTAVVTASFSLLHMLGALAVSIIGATALGLAVGLLAAGAWFLIREELLQAIISLLAPFAAYLPANALHVSGVLAVVTTGFVISYFSPRALSPNARIRGQGFWNIVFFIANAVIFLLVGLQFHSILQKLSHFSASQLLLYGLAISLAVIVVRALWVFAQGLLPVTNEPEHVEGTADWSHVALLAWTGMRGGVSLAAALAIPFETAAGPFPHRDLIIFITFCVLLVTLVGQAGTLPLLIRWMHVVDDGASEREERVALAQMSRAALRKLDELQKRGNAPPALLERLRRRFANRWQEFGEEADDNAARGSATYRQLQRELIDAQRTTLIRLRNSGKIDNTVMRKVQRLLDLESEEVELLGGLSHVNVDAIQQHE